MLDSLSQEFKKVAVGSWSSGVKREQMLVAPHTYTDMEISSPWSAVYTRHQHEKTVAEMLNMKGFEVFLPLYESVRRWKQRRKVLQMPLFPCYVFVRGAVAKRLPVLTTPGVHMLLCEGDKVATIPEEEIQAIRRTVDGDSRVEPHPFLKCGDRVRVIRGSLSGIEGFLVRKKNVFRLVLSVSMLAQSVAVEVYAEDVEPVGTRVSSERPNLNRQVDLQSPELPIRAYGAQFGVDMARPELTAKVG
jgi:transcription antitermination factor NusG